MIIAIDGPAGAGKSTVCRILAERLRFVYLDTGAMYRALAWALLSNEAGLSGEEISGRLPRLSLDFLIKEGGLVITHEGKELTNEIRNMEIADEASRISQFESVRSYLLNWQRRLGEQGDIVAEGRDTTTVVFPQAELKVFLTADLNSRVERRRREYMLKGIDVSPGEMERRIRERDEADSKRALAPMRPAEDAIILDTSDLDISQVVESLVRMAKGLIARDGGQKTGDG